MSWADQFNTYAEACDYYGADHPDAVKAEYDELGQDQDIGLQDELEAGGASRPGSHHLYMAAEGLLSPDRSYRAEVSFLGLNPADAFPF